MVEDDDVRMDRLRWDCLPALADNSLVLRYLMATYKFFVPATVPGGGTTQALPKLQYSGGIMIADILKRQKLK